MMNSMRDFNRLLRNHKKNPAFGGRRILFKTSCDQTTSDHFHDQVSKCRLQSLEGEIFYPEESKCVENVIGFVPSADAGDL
jgi:hypothetical protein